MFFYGANANGGAVNLPMAPSMTSNIVLESSSFLTPISGAPMRLTPNASVGLPPLPPGLETARWIPAFYNCSTQVQYMLQPGRTGACALRLPARVNRTVRCNDCGITLNSAHQAQQHYSGKSHLRRLQRLQQQKRRTSSNEENEDDGPIRTASPHSSDSSSVIQDGDSVNDKPRKRSLSVCGDELPKKSFRPEEMETWQNDVTDTGVEKHSDDDVTNDQCTPPMRSLGDNGDTPSGEPEVKVDDVLTVTSSNQPNNDIEDGPSISSNSESSDRHHQYQLTTAETSQTSETVSDNMVDRIPMADRPCQLSCSTISCSIPLSHVNHAAESGSSARPGGNTLSLPVRHPCNLALPVASEPQRYGDLVSSRIHQAVTITGRQLAAPRVAGTNLSSVNCYYVNPQIPSIHKSISQFADILPLSHPSTVRYVPVYSQLPLNGSSSIRFALTGDVTYADARENCRVPVAPTAAGTRMCGLNGRSVLDQALSMRSIVGVSIAEFEHHNHSTFIRDISTTHNPSRGSNLIQLPAETSTSLHSQSPAGKHNKGIDWPAGNQSEATPSCQLSESFKSLDPVSKAVYENFLGKLTAPKLRNNRRRNYNMMRR